MSESDEKPKPLAEAMFAYHWAESEFESALSDAGFTYGKLGGDHYDNSVEFYHVEPNQRMSEAAQRIVYDAGFSKAYVNHTDGWETHYNWNQREPFKPYRGWRRRYVSDPSASTTRVIVGEPDNGYWEIGYWPEGWGARSMEERDRGYFRIVPDPLE